MGNTTDDDNVTQFEIITLTCPEANHARMSCDDDNSNCSSNSDYLSTCFIMEDTEVVSLDNLESHLKDKALKDVRNGLDLKRTVKASHNPGANINSPYLAELECGKRRYYKLSLSDEEAIFDTLTPDGVIESQPPETVISAARIYSESTMNELKFEPFSPTSSDYMEHTKKYNRVYYEEKFPKVSPYLRDTAKGRSNQKITTCASETFERGQVDGQPADETGIAVIDENWNCALSANLNTNLIKCDQDSLCKFSNKNLFNCGIKEPTNIIKGETFVCEFCKKSLPSKARLRVHIMTHIGEQTYLCKMCGVRFGYSSALKAHLRKHTGDTFSCPICKVEYKSKQGIMSHINSHSGKKPYGCDKCNERFQTLSSLKIHLQRHDGSLGNKYIPCPICDKTFVGRKSLKIHLQTHLVLRNPLTKSVGYTCKICNKILKSINWYTQHLKFHTTKCKFCRMNFENSEALKTHVTCVHGREKPFLCDTCGKGFNYRYTLAAHKKVHDGESPHVCEYCQRAFSYAPDLLEHKRIHTKEKPYKCEFCSTRFAQRGSLRAHLNRGGQETCTCNICQKNIPCRCFRAHLMTHDIEEFCLVTIGDTPSEYDMGSKVSV